MTDSYLLRKKIDESGYKIRYVADKLGLTYQGLQKKIANATQFKATEIQTLKVLLCLTNEERDQIFFARIVDL